MKTLLRLTLALSAVLGMSAVRVIAADSRVIEAWIRFKELDANANGELSLREFKRHLKDEEAHKARLLFERLDRDTDSSLKFDEFKNVVPGR